MSPESSGHVQVYTGDGKGKTTAAIGLSIRAAGHGFSTYIGQFMKGQAYGEIAVLTHLPKITIEQYGDEGCIRKEDVSTEHIAAAEIGLEKARSALVSGRYDVVVLDEINVALWFGLLAEDAVLRLMNERPAGVELVLTGRRAPTAILERADLITEMQEVMHYYTKGIVARKGIEY